MNNPSKTIRNTVTWRPVSEAPKLRNWRDALKPALLYSEQLGVITGSIAVSQQGVAFGHLPGYHGCAVRDWGVTLWARVPHPYKNRRHKEKKTQC